MTDNESASYVASTEEISVYEDWRQRRKQLNPEAAAGPPGKLLDFLLSRYADEPKVREPAQFALIHDFDVNNIAMVVNHHLAKRGRLGTTRNAAEAESRIAQVVRRMTTTPENLVDIPDPLELDGPKISVRTLKRMQAAWKWLNDRASQGLPLGPEPQSAAELKMPGRFGSHTPWSAVVTLCRVDHPRAVSYSLLAWRRLLSTYGRCWVTNELEFRFSDLNYRAMAVERIRSALGDSSFDVRCRAMQLLSNGFGDLQDLGLLLDLYALPNDIVDEIERGELLLATNKLSGRIA